MKYLKTFENFNAPHQEEPWNPIENAISNDENSNQLKTKEEQEKEEQEAIERLNNGFTSVVIPKNVDE